jgi:hypothetical protein
LASCRRLLLRSRSQNQRTDCILLSLQFLTLSYTCTPQKQHKEKSSKCKSIIKEEYLVGNMQQQQPFWP